MKLSTQFDHLTPDEKPWYMIECETMEEARVAMAGPELLEACKTVKKFLEHIYADGKNSFSDGAPFTVKNSIVYSDVLKAISKAESKGKP